MGILEVLVELCLTVFVNITIFFIWHRGSVKVVIYFLLQLQWMIITMWYSGGSGRGSGTKGSASIGAAFWLVFDVCKMDDGYIEVLSGLASGSFVIGFEGGFSDI